MLIPVAAILAMQIAGTEPPIGVAAASRDGQICVAMPAPALTPGTILTLIQPDAPQSVLTATIGRPVSVCQPLGGAMLPGPFYLAHRTAPRASESDALWVAFVGKFETRRLDSGAIAVPFSAAYPNAQVRSCTSHESFHLTVWSDAPLTSQRLWHQYYYLGYDVEPSCDDREFRDPVQSTPTSESPPGGG